MTKILKIFIPAIFGILTVWGLFKIEEIMHFGKFGTDDEIYLNLEMLFILPVALFLIFIQVIFTLPIWNLYKKREKILNLTLKQFFSVLCVFGGTLFGLLFWAKQFGIKDLIITCLIGLISFASYWTINLLTLNQIEKWTQKE